ncbi:MAG TPA: hypothetical protein VG164_07585 [Trebonia sp.]|nr:hypothetical protein [Trebonia sp.]
MADSPAAEALGVAAPTAERWIAGWRVRPTIMENRRSGGGPRLRYAATMR